MRPEIERLKTSKSKNRTSDADLATTDNQHEAIMGNSLERLSTAQVLSQSNTESLLQCRMKLRKQARYSLPDKTCGDVS